MIWVCNIICHVGPVNLLYACMFDWMRKLSSHLTLCYYEYVDGELSSPIDYILCLQVGWVKNSPLKCPFYGRTLSDWILEIEPKWALELGWGIIRLTTGLRGFRLAQVLVLGRDINLFTLKIIKSKYTLFFHFYLLYLFFLF